MSHKLSSEPTVIRNCESTPITRKDMQPTPAEQNLENLRVSVQPPTHPRQDK